MRTIVLIAAIALSANCFGQDSIPRIIFGFDVGANYSNSQLRNSDPGVKLNNTAGFCIGVLSDVRLRRHLSFSPKAEMAINNSNIAITSAADEKTVYKLYNAIVDLQAHFNYKFCNSKTAPYILIGPSYKIPLIGNSKSAAIMQRSGFAADVGIGLDKKLTYFNIAPELRYSYGLNNLNRIVGTGQLYYHQLTLILVFKG